MWSGELYESWTLVDTSAIVALVCREDRNHLAAREFYRTTRSLMSWYILDATQHEAFTRVRYKADFPLALRAVRLCRARCLTVLSSDREDELVALRILKRHREQRISFHDALSVAIMLRHKIRNAFAFDQDFYTLGVAMLPGQT